MKRKRLYNFVLFLLAVILQANGQSCHNLTSQLNQFRDNDILYRVHVNDLPDIGKWRGRIWDLRYLHLGEDDKLSYATLPHDTTVITAKEKYSRCYYTLRHDSLLLLGSESNLLKMVYDRPEAILRFPFTYGDKIEGVFHGTGTYCERTMIRCYGTYHVEADACGSLILPERDTLFNVLRVHSVRNTRTEHYALPFSKADEIKMKLSFTAISTTQIRDSVTREQDVVETHTYQYFATGYRYPVYEAVENYIKTDAMPMAKEALYLSPHNQNSLSYDPVNERLRRKVTNEENEDSPIVPSAHPFIKYKVDIVDAKQLILSFNLHSTAYLGFGFYTSDGRTVLFCSPQEITAGSHFKEIPLDTLQPGVYLFKIVAGEDVYTEKITLKY